MSLSEIVSRVQKAEMEANRPIGSTRVIAVSKLQPNERVLALLAEGHAEFGENRVQEAAGKWPEFLATYPHTKLHLLGPLQSNKARQAMQLFECIHSIDRTSLVTRIVRIADEIGSCPDLFVQVNTGEEPQKSGVLPGETDQLVAEIRKYNLPLLGLMCIPPFDEEPALHFGLLANLARRNGLSNLSMGMSNDFDSAVRMGATHIRVGTAIFGERDYSKR
ncbi:MAG: YggS family pyridoxal phosphate-dependent enzyme [Paracoccaceae bacterium]|nr:YggS family pyridoxal phosphate-dependent enzyme [Paracoccaceae bacterium]MDE2917885.1 YggS family pyridoxal phosphate-dependent enzyme [Paracoccaceae bacterium]